MSDPALVELVEHETSASAAECVAEEAAVWLGICCLAGSASVALPGGRSPYVMLKHLASHPIRWDRVTVTTTDERKVPLDHALSNMGNLRRAFEGQIGERAMFVPLKDRYAYCSVRLPFDLLVLGVGADGHIASLFPGMDFGRSTDFPIIDVTPESLPCEAPVARWSWTLPALTSARRTFLLCAGRKKRAAIDAALQSFDGPLGAFLAGVRGPVTIHWTERT